MKDDHFTFDDAHMHGDRVRMMLYEKGIKFQYITTDFPSAVECLYNGVEKEHLMVVKGIADEYVKNNLQHISVKVGIDDRCWQGSVSILFIIEGDLE